MAQTLNFQAEKNLIRAYYREIEASNPKRISEVLARFTTPDWKWMGFHPFNDLIGAQAVAEVFWKPFMTSLTSLQRREDIFFAGKNEMDGFSSTWVVSMGHLMGLFDAPWLGIAPTRKLALLRYCEFNKVENERISETAFYFDIPHLMVQAGQNPFASQTAQHLVQPGPKTHDGLQFCDAEKEEGEVTLQVINAMIGNLGSWQSGMSLVDELALNWHDDMVWWGPEGVGATYTIERYAQQHSGPFRATFTHRSNTTHKARLAEGNYGGFFGRPNFTAIHKGGFMGRPGNDVLGEFRVIDIYRRDGAKLAENWVFIDLLHWLLQQGEDVLGRVGDLS